MSSEGWELRPVAYDHPDAQALTARVQRFYVQLYGGPDETPWTVADFAPPRGGFVVGYLHDVPVAMGGWRFREATAFADRPAEIKRMYVVERVRRRGLAERVLSRLEAEAGAQGADWTVLETGRPQAAAVAFYAAAGYVAVEPFGYYGAEPGAINLGKRLN